MKYSNEVLCIEISKRKITLQAIYNNNEKKIVDLNSFIDSNSEIIQKEFLNIFDQFSEDLNIAKYQKNFPFWWANELLENTNFEKERNYDDFIRILALKIFVKKNDFKKIIVSGDQRKLIYLLTNIFKKEKINYINNSKKIHTSLLFNKAYYFLFNLFKGIFASFYFPFIYFCFYKKYKFNSNNFDLIFLNYLNIQKKTSKSNLVFEGYDIWGDLIDSESLKEKKILFVHLALNEKKGFRSNPSNQLLTLWKKDRNFHIFIYSLIGWDIFFLSIKDYFLNLLIFFKANNLIKEKIIFNFFFKKFSEGFLNQKAVKDIIIYHLFKKLLKKTKCNELILYPCENYALEVGFNAAARKYSEANLCGYVHTVVRRWDLRYLRSSKFPKNLIPNKILLNREIDRKTLNEIDHTESKKVLIRSLRYLGLEKAKLYNPKKSQENELNIIIFLSYSKEKNKELIDCFIESSKNLSFKFNLFIKFHPIKSFIIPKSLKFIKLENIHEYLHSSHIKTLCIINSYTSVGLECAHLNFPIIDKIDSDRLPFSSLEETSKLKKVKNGEEMKEALESFFYKDLKDIHNNLNSLNFESIKKTIESIYD